MTRSASLAIPLVERSIVLMKMAQIASENESSREVGKETKNLCVRVGCDVNDRLEQICRVLSISKQAVLTDLLLAGLTHIESRLLEEGVEL